MEIEIPEAEVFYSLKKISDILQFILKYKNRFEKRKYFIIDKNYNIIKESPCFALELSYIYFNSGLEKSNAEKNKIEKLIMEELKTTFIDKEKRIDRLSKMEKERLTDSFRRSILNGNTVHSVKLGNELLHRDKNEFFKILYTVSLISLDGNRLIKTYFAEKIIEEICEKENNSLNKNRSQADEVVKNIINYFVKSEPGYIDFKNEDSIKYFLENKACLLYKKIYEKNYEDITRKYNISSVKKIELEKNIEKEYENLCEIKKVLYKFIEQI